MQIHEYKTKWFLKNTNKENMMDFMLIHVQFYMLHKSVFIRKDGSATFPLAHKAIIFKEDD